MQENTTAPASPPMALAVLALEMETTVEALEREVGADNVFMHGGLRSVTGFRARELAEAHHARKAEAARLAKRNQEQLQAYHAAQHAAIPKGFTKFEMGRVTIEPGGGDGVPAVVRMTAGSDKTFEGGTYTKRPGKFDWLLGRGEGGEQIGPTKRQLAEHIKEQKALNKKARGGGK